MLVPVASTLMFWRITLLRCSWLPLPSGVPETSTSTRLLGVMKPLTPVTLSTFTDMARIPSVISSGISPVPCATTRGSAIGWFFSMVARASFPTTASTSDSAPSGWNSFGHGTIFTLVRSMLVPTGIVWLATTMPTVA